MAESNQNDRDATTKSQVMRARELFEAYLTRHAANDLEGVVVLFEADARVEDPVGSPTHRGLDAIRAFYRGTHRANGPMSIERVGAVLCGGDEIAALGGGGGSRGRTRLYDPFPDMQGQYREFRRPRRRSSRPSREFIRRFEDLKENSLRTRTGNILRRTGKFSSRTGIRKSRHHPYQVFRQLSPAGAVRPLSGGPTSTR